MIRGVVVLLLLLPSSLMAQYDSVRRTDAIRFADGAFHTYTSPVRWKGKDWLKFGGILAGTAALTLADQPIRDFWSNQQSGFLDGVNVIGYHYGKPYTAFLLSGGFYAGGLLFKNEWARETGLVLATGLLTTGLLEMALKPSVGRARPGNEEGNYDVTFFNKDAGYHSFPSGHATMAFTMSFIMAKRIKSVPVKIFFYSLAASTVVCRLYSDAHWSSDIAFGSVLAWYCSEAVIKRLQTNRVKKLNRKTDWSITPYAGGLTLRARFR
jgi:membrane-associated phospholipid phosphatase